ncbi:hypothetical protein [Deinococcus koreensis]|uniref:Uncharacterized protein n=1 Tax=Deinococcus koreensis TaxID=2054903 RepID=A0A2K3US04_9DEIO|nr:hypothetical protein [Deinococcus koreensis]PNY79329.1 hypothetical protein CVO96_19580 [Deinococcus koreensis]
MTDPQPGHEAARPQARSLTSPEDAAEGAAPGERPAGTCSSWLDVKRHFEPGVAGAGLGEIPEPDSAEFPPFLATLHARNPPLALALVAATRRLRQGLDLPSSRAAQRRERRRATRRLLFMRRTPEGRWVADKRKAPLYGMLGLLLSGALLTAVYALPRLAAAPEMASSAQTTPVAPGKRTTPTGATPTAESEAALVKSREALARFRTQQAARNPQPAAPVGGPSGPTTRTGREPGAITGGLVGGAARSTTTFKPLSTEASPPPPPVVPERRVRRADRPPPALFTPVTVAPAPQPPTPPAPAAPPGGSFGAPPDPRPLPWAPTPARPTRAPAARPVAAARPAPPSTAAARPAPPAHGGAALTRASEAPDVNAAFGALRVMPAPGDAPESADSPRFTGGAEAPSMPAVRTLSSSTVRDTIPVTAPPPPDTAGFASGVVYERAPRPAVAAAAVGSGAGETLPAETPFGSEASIPASTIGATGPFAPLQQVPATLMTAIRTPGGGSVPVVAVTPDGGSFVGLATIQATLARVDMQFRRYVAADGTIFAIDALAYSRDPGGLTQGLAAQIQVVAPTLALDAAQNSANALNTYVQNVAAAARTQGTSITLGDNLTLSGPSVATLAQTLLGGLGSTFRMPETAQSVTRIATVRGNVPLIVIAGLGGEGR